MPRRKRGIKGAGSVYRRKSDGRYVGSFIVEETGKRKYLYADTEKEAWSLLQEALQQQKQDTLATGPQQKLGSYLNQWIEEVYKPTVRISTYYRNRKILDNYIIPELGNVPLQKLKPQQIQALYTKSLKKGLSPGTVKGIHQALRKALATAVRWRLIGHNVCDDVSPPQRTNPEIHPLTKEQAKILLETARGHILEALLILALATGMRLGEMLGLTWSDIDLENGSLQIKRTIGRVGPYGLIESEPKTAAGKRKILLPGFVIEALKQQRIRQKEMRLKAGEKWEDHDFVFYTLRGRPLEKNRMHQMFGPLLQEAGLPHIRFHDLRHSTATFLLSMGVHPKVVQEILGHSRISMTLDTYSHVLPTMHEEAMSKLDSLFEELK